MFTEKLPKQKSNNFKTNNNTFSHEMLPDFCTDWGRGV